MVGLESSEKSDNVSLSCPNIDMWGAGCPNFISLVRAGLPERFEIDSVILLKKVDEFVISYT